MSDGVHEELVALGVRMLSEGLVVGTSGNVSARRMGGADEFVVTPTGVDYHELKPAELPVVDSEGRQLAGELCPTSELPLHLAAYRAHPEAAAVVHTHAVHATAVSTLVDTVPNIHYMLAVAGGPVRVAGYATYGSEELAAAAVQALADRSACLLGNHGTLALGGSLARAYETTVQLESACRVWLAARAAGEPRLLDDAEIDNVAEKLRGYGQPAKRSAK